MRDDDAGFVCKACGHFFADFEVREWDTKWESREGQDALVRITHRCPLCGEVVSYTPNEGTFRRHANP
jgi:hypothetical protein